MKLTRFKCKPKTFLLCAFSLFQGIKERKCDMCNKYYYETAYWRHMKTVHASAETFVYSCDVCNKQFTHRLFFYYLLIIELILV